MGKFFTAPSRTRARVSPWRTIIHINFPVTVTENLTHFAAIARKICTKAARRTRVRHSPALFFGISDKTDTHSPSTTSSEKRGFASHFGVHLLFFSESQNWFAQNNTCVPASSGNDHYFWKQDHSAPREYRRKSPRTNSFPETTGNGHQTFVVLRLEITPCHVVLQADTIYPVN